MLELGGNIKLDGFSDIDPAKLVVVKKLVGNYARKISDDVSPFQELVVRLQEDGEAKNFAVSSTVTFEGKSPVTTQDADPNLFFGLNRTLNELLNAAR